MNGLAAFAPKPEEFIRALPESGRVFIRAPTAASAHKDTNFVLSGVSKIKEKIGRACNWSSTSDDTTGSIIPPQKHQQKALTRAPLPNQDQPPCSVLTSVSMAACRS
jgi:hypothetical protein